MTGPKVTLAEGKKHVARVLEQLEGGRWQLIGILLSLPEPLAEQVRLEDMSDRTDALTELRTTIACVLEDYIRPALQDLRDVLASTAEEEDETEKP